VASLDYSGTNSQICRKNSERIILRYNKKMKLKSVLAYFFIVGLILSSCSAKGSNSRILPTATSSDPANEIKIPEVIPQPITGTGSVIGKVSFTTSEELIGVIIYLGDVIQIDENLTGGYLDVSTAPHTMIETSTGRFLFKDITPGKYSIIIYEVGLGGKAYQDASGNVMVVEVKEGIITDVGSIPNK